jgi:hypothetical protein
VWYGKALSMSAICAAARRAYQPNSPVQPQLQARSLTCLTDNGLAWHARRRQHSISSPCSGSCQNTPFAAMRPSSPPTCTQPQPFAVVQWMA